MNSKINKLASELTDHATKVNKITAAYADLARLTKKMRRSTDRMARKLKRDQHRQLVNYLSLVADRIEAHGYSRPNPIFK
jgi:septal ring factor EnvC (AmiA/AmiB activator)